MKVLSGRAMPRVKMLCALVASCFAADALANPTGPSVVSGNASFSNAGKALTVTNSPNAIINWQGFSIGAGEITRFQQQSAASSVLNRVTGQDPSAIFGTLSSNGRVFLINPNGVLFGQGSRIDVAGLVASSLNTTNQDFLAGKLNFRAGAVAGSVVNQGEITSAAGGRIYLIAPDVQNHGLISSPGGEVLLAAGRAVSLVDADVPNLKVEVQSGGEALNVGKIIADGGKAGIYAGLINQRGIVRADSVSKDATGRIVFKATDTTILDDGSVTSAAGAKGGAIQVLGSKVGLVGTARVDASGDAGGGTVLIGGDYQGKNADVQNAYRTYMGPQSSITADAITSGDGGKVIVWSDDATRAYGSISARGGSQSGNGGFVETSGKNWLDFDAAVNASAPKGATGVLLLDPAAVSITNTSDAGGSFGGGNPDIFSAGFSPSTLTWNTIKTHLGAANVYVTTSGCSIPGSCGIDILANSPDLTASNTLRLISHEAINVNGSVLNTGSGALEMYAGWNGASTATPILNNSAGTIAVNAPITFAGDVSLRSFGNTTVSFPVSAGGNVLIDVQGASSNASVNASISSTAAGPSSLQIKAANTVSFSSGAGITAGAGPLNITLNSDSDGSGAGRIFLGSGSAIASNGGDVTLGGGANPLTGYAVGDGPTGTSMLGVYLTGASINAGAGNISIRGKGAAGTTLAAGVDFDTGSVLQTTNGNITLDGVGGAGALGGRNWGILLEDPGTQITSVNGTITLTGQGGSSTGFAAGPIDGRNRGIELFQGASVTTTGTGNISLTGTGGSSVDQGSNTGVLISQANPVGTKVETVNGSITIAGSGGSTSGAGAVQTANRGVSIGAAEVRSTGTGSISITGTGGTTNNNAVNSSNSGVLVQGDDVVGIMAFVQSAGGNVSITGTAGSSTAAGTHEGMIIANRATVQSGGSGALNLTGTAPVIAIRLSGGGGVVAPMTVHAEAGGALTVNANGGGLLTLSTVGGTLTNEFVELVSNGNQTINAGGILLSAGTSGSGNSVEIGSGGTQNITAGASGISLTGGSVGSDNYAQIVSLGSQNINSTDINLTGGEGTQNFARFIQLGSSGLQTISATGAITMIAGGNTSSGVRNYAQIEQRGNGLQHVTADSITLEAGGGASGDRNSAAIFTSSGTTASQQVDIGAGGLSMQGGTGSLGQNKAGIWVLADQTTNSGTVATQVVNVSGGGSITIIGGSNGLNSPSGNNNNAGIYAAATGAGSSQTVTVAGTGGITLIGGDSGVSNHANIWSFTPTQTITTGSGGITLLGDGGATGTNDKAFIFQEHAAGSQSITVNGGGSILAMGGSGSGGQNFGQILNNGSGQQSITFTAPGGVISLYGGTGDILTTASSGNLASIDAAVGNQTIAGSVAANNPSIFLNGGDSGGNTGGSATLLGNNAFIRATLGAQSISAGAIDLTAGAGGVDNSATIQAPSQVISASSVTIDGGGASGTFAGARIGGIGGLAPGATNLSLTTTGDVTLTGGSVSGVSIGANSAGGVATNIAIDSGGSVILNSGTGAGARIGSPASNMGSGNISITAGGNVEVNGGTTIRTLGAVAIDAAGALMLTGGSSGTGQSALVLSGGDQTITAGSIALNGGAAGGADLNGNFAQLVSTGGAQSITTAGDLALNAGAAGINNFATISAATQNVTVHGNLSLTGGGSSPSADGTIGGGARIGGLGGASATATNLNLTVDGNVTMTGGSVANSGAAIGSNIQGGQTTTITMGVGGNVTLNPGTVANGGSRIGSPAGAIAGGDIAITSGGTLALNSTGPGLGTAIRTLGNLTITAASMTQGPDSQIIAGGATTLNGGSIALSSANNDFTGAVSLNSSGANNVAITDANAIVLGSSNLGTGTLTVTAGGAITQTGPVVQAAGAGQATFDSTGGGAITLTNTGNDFTGSVDLGTSGVVAITDANSFIIHGGGGGGPNASSLTINANGAVTQSAAFTGSAPTVIQINAGSGPIQLNNTGNNFSGNTSVAANSTGAVSLTNGNASGINLGTSSVGGALTLTSGGPVTQSGPLTVTGASTINAGSNTILLANASNDFIGAVNFTGGNVTLTDANAIAIGTTNVSGALNIVATSTSFLNGLNATNYSFSGGTYSLASGTYNLGGTTSIAQNPSTGAVTVVEVATGATINTSGGTVNVGAGGTLSGTGTIQGNVNNSAGTVSPGASPGMLTITGNYTQGPSGVLDMQIGVPVSGTPVAGIDYDQLKVLGSATLGGTLNATLLGTPPVPGTAFTLVDASGGITGTFTTVNQPVGSLFNSFYGLTTFEFIAASSSSVPAPILPTFQNTIVSTDQVLVALTTTTTTSTTSDTGLMFVPGGNIDVAPATTTTTTTTADGKIVPKPPACN